MRDEELAGCPNIRYVQGHLRRIAEAKNAFQYTGSQL